ncbi:helix-turn-helix domain-containing protein [Microlunatus sp. Gsoil 973]|nr:helix-turn-helix domain-containing protein [Microlunatus sp. Gsoil 973]
MFADRPVLAGVWYLDGDAEVHGHDFIEIALIGHGTGRHLNVRGEQPLVPGDLLVLRPGAWHGFVDCVDLEVANCCLSAQALDGRLSFLYSDPVLRQLLWTGPVLAGRQGNYAVRLRADAAAAGVSAIRKLGAVSGAGLGLIGQLLITLGLLVDALPDARPAGAADGQAAAPPGWPETPGVIREVAALMAAGPERPWRVEELADLAALDPDYLGRLFRRHLGVSPMTYLARIRVERAARLLTHTADPAARIGALVGWPDPTYFARRFRQLTGLTPTAYRDRARARGAGIEPAVRAPETESAAPEAADTPHKSGGYVTPRRGGRGAGRLGPCPQRPTSTWMS